MFGRCEGWRCEDFNVVADRVVHLTAHMERGSVCAVYSHVAVYVCSMVG